MIALQITQIMLTKERSEFNYLETHGMPHS